MAIQSNQDTISEPTEEKITNMQMTTKSSNKAIFILISILFIILVSLVMVVAFLFMNQSSNSQEIVPTSAIVPTQTSIPTVIAPSAINPMKNFTSLIYKVSFNYPISLGLATATHDKNYFNNEYVTFENSDLLISYWKFEGGDVCDEGKRNDEFISKDGKSCTVYCIDDTQHFSYAQCNEPSSNYDVTFVHEGSQNKQIDVDAIMLKGIISTLSFDSSDVQLNYDQ
jgi:hypothetical protein